MDWERGEKSALVSIGSHKLFLSVYGPDRRPGEPVVVLLTGLGSSITEWVVARKLVSRFARIYLYERSGYGQSEESPNPPSSTVIACELKALLQAANIKPPYVTIGHSWGGILSREFRALSPPGDIAGMVFVDASTDKRHVLTFEESCVSSVLQGIDHIPVTGLSETHVLSPDEWKAMLEEEAKPEHIRQAEAESKEFALSRDTLAEKRQIEEQPPLLGNRPVSVLRCNTTHDFEMMYHEGVRRNNGTKEEQKAVQDILDRAEAVDEELQKRTLRLSSNHHYAHTVDNGHNVQFTQPELVAEEVRWVLQNLE